MLNLEDQHFQDSIAQLFVSLTNEDSVVSDSLPAFNPNLVKYDSLLKWGFTSYIASNMIKYREAGGRFHKSSDLKKVFGMTDSIWLAIYPSIRIPVGGKQPKSHETKSTFDPESNSDAGRRNINNVDSIWLQTIYGIGPVLSKRIVKYRNLLGGFYSKDQLHEVYGLSDEIIAELQAKLSIPTNPELARIDLNRAGLKQLTAHPYLSYGEAQAIIAYRKQHGRFESVEGIKKIHLISDSTYLRVYPYLDF